MTNFELIKSLDVRDLSLFIVFYKYCKHFDTARDLQQWLNSNIDKYFWFHDMEILQLEEKIDGQQFRTT
jgi:hypothetical protein